MVGVEECQFSGANSTTKTNLLNLLNGESCELAEVFIKINFKYLLADFTTIHSVRWQFVTYSLAEYEKWNSREWRANALKSSTELFYWLNFRAFRIKHVADKDVQIDFASIFELV